MFGGDIGGELDGGRSGSLAGCIFFRSSSFTNDQSIKIPEIDMLVIKGLMQTEMCFKNLKENYFEKILLCGLHIAV